MRIIKLETNDPSINLSSEYYYLTNPKFENEDIIIFWKNKNTIVIGRNQCLHTEVNQIKAKEFNTKIVRRFSGGGSVYQDDGNICFTFIKRNKKNSFNFQESLKDIIEFLNLNNLNASFSGRNDILIDNKKISGNAVYFYKNDYMIHGTLLFNLDVERMVNLLTVDKSKLISKGIESVKSRVLNICEIFDGNINDFENSFINFFENKYNRKVENISLLNNLEVQKINSDTFNNYEWIYGRDFEFNFSNKLKTDKGLLMLNLKTNNNIIEDIEIYSDSLMSLDIKKIQNIFLNKKYEINTIKEVVSNIDLNQILENLTIKQLIELFFNNSSN